MTSLKHDSTVMEPQISPVNSLPVRSLSPSTFLETVPDTVENSGDDGYFRQIEPHRGLIARAISSTRLSYPKYGPPVNDSSRFNANNNKSESVYSKCQSKTKRRFIPTTKEMKTNFRDNLSYCKSIIF